MVVAVPDPISLARPEAAYFWATHTGAELDLLLVKRGRRYGVEVKFQDAPRLTPSMRIALSDLRLEHLTVLYPGDLRYALDRRVTVVPLAELAARPEVITRGRHVRPPGGDPAAGPGRARGDRRLRLRVDR